MFGPRLAPDFGIVATPLAAACQALEGEEKG